MICQIVTNSLCVAFCEDRTVREHCKELIASDMHTLSL